MQLTRRGFLASIIALLWVNPTVALPKPCSYCSDPQWDDMCGECAWSRQQMEINRLRCDREAARIAERMSEYDQWLGSEDG